MTSLVTLHQIGAVPTRHLSLRARHLHFRSSRKPNEITSSPRTAIVVVSLKYRVTHCMYVNLSRHLMQCSRTENFLLSTYYRALMIMSCSSMIIRNLARCLPQTHILESLAIMHFPLRMGTRKLSLMFVAYTHTLLPTCFRSFAFAGNIVSNSTSVYEQVLQLVIPLIRKSLSPSVCRTVCSGFIKPMVVMLSPPQRGKSSHMVI